MLSHQKVQPVPRPSSPVPRATSPVPRPSSPVYSKWGLDSCFVGCVDFANALEIAGSRNNNTIAFTVASAQLEAYSPIEDKVYLNEAENLYAVFDGHGGDMCSRYIADKLPKQLLSALKKRKPQSELEYTSILKSTFMHVDDQFLSEHKHVVKTSPSGSCGVTVLVRNNSLYVCNLGDSRVLLGSRSQKWSHKLLTSDHNTKNEQERQLVEKRTTDPMPIRGHAINKVKGDRIGGVLMVTRAFGDGLFKRKDMSLPPFIHYLPYITNEPDVTIHKLSPEDRYVVISSDGLYEYFTPADVAEIVEKQLQTTSDGAKIAAALIEAQFETIAKLAGKTAEHVKAIPVSSRKCFMDDTSLIVIVFDHSSGGAAE